jgi:cytochrome c2
MRALIVLPLLAALAAGCGGGKTPEIVNGGDVKRGAAVIEKYGCGGCHQIPGSARADGRVGPSLDGFRRIRYIAGRLPNNPENARRWIEDPRKIEPGTVMPDLGVSEDEARDAVAYLYSRT